MTYQLAARGVTHVPTGQQITPDMVEWADYRAWLKAGNTPAPLPADTRQRWPDLATGQREVWALAKLRRDTLEASGVPYRGHPLDSDPRAVQRINTAVQAAQAAAAAGQPFRIGWTCMDGHVLDLDVAGMIGMPAALAIYANGLHQIARGFKDRIAAASSIQELDSICADIEAWI